MDPFEFLDVSLEEVTEVLEEAKRNPHRRDGAICLCGHGRSKHIEGPLGFTCAPAKQFCPCKVMRIVVETSDTRHFLFRTEGAGALHALLKGVGKAQKVGAEVEWVGGSICDKCGKDGKVSPVPVSQRGVSMNEATGYDALLCVNCRLEV